MIFNLHQITDHYQIKIKGAIHVGAFVGEELDYQPLSYWAHVNFFNKDEAFDKAEGKETTIVRFTLKSSHREVEAVTARKEGGRIFYQIYSDPDLEPMSFKKPFISSDLPLTLRELIGFIDRTQRDDDHYAEYGLVRSAWEHSAAETDENLQEAVDFVEIDSPIYKPFLASYYEEVGRIWIAEKLKERTSKP